MSTYEAVIVLLIGAGLLVVLAVWHITAPAGPRRPRRWVAVGASGTTIGDRSSWVTSLRQTVDSAEAIDLTAPGALLRDVRTSQLGPAISARPTVTVIWVGVEDMVHGAPLGPFLRELTNTIDRLHAARSHVVVVGLPPLRMVAATHGLVRRPHQFERLLRDWQEGIEEIARRGGATIIDWPSDSAVTSAVLDGTKVALEPDLLSDVAERVRPVIRRLLGSPRTSDAVRPAWDEPADPVVRRRMGLPDIR